jgi:hypothetical protein
MRKFAHGKNGGLSVAFIVARDARVRLLHENALPQLAPCHRVRRLYFLKITLFHFILF